MAENKVVNITQLESDLTSIANAIREKSGASGSLVFPDGFADAIASIASVPSEIAELSSGVYIPAGTTSATIAHGLSQKPHFAIIFAPTISTTGIAAVAIATGKKDDSSEYVLRAYSGYVGSAWTNCSQPTYASLTATNIQTGSNRTLTAGTTYYWVCGRFNTN